MMNKKIILCIIITAVAFFTASAKKYYVLSIGVSDYPGAEMDLKLPSADARAVAGVWKKNSDATVRLLLNEEATIAAIVKNGRQLFSSTKEDDVIVLFFSGHGYSGGFYAYDGCLNFDKVRKMFAASKSKSKMIFADACYSGSIISGESAKPDTLAGAKTDIGADVMLFLSCRETETSFEIPSMRNGVFAACLVKSLKGGADANKDRTITARELFEAVHKGVIKISYDRQHPVMRGHFKDDMVVISWKKKEK